MTKAVPCDGRRLRIYKANTPGAYYLRFDLAKCKQHDKAQVNQYINQLRKGFV